MLAAVKGFAVWVWSFSLCRTKAADSGRQLPQITLHVSTSALDCSRLLSSLFHFSPLLWGRERKRQIRLLPQKLPITAWQCVQHCCLRNAEFVNPVRLKGIRELNFGCRFKWVKYCRCMDITVARRVAKMGNKSRSVAFYSHLFIPRLTQSEGLHNLWSEDIHHQQ